MFVNSWLPFPEQKPWLLPLRKRFSMLRPGTFRVVYYSQAPNTSSMRYRVWNMVQMLNRYSAEVSASFFFSDDGPELLSALKQARVLVVHRTSYSSQLEWLIENARKLGVTVLYDADDLIFEPAFVPEIMDTLDVLSRSDDAREPDLWQWWLGYTTGHKMAAIMCDGFIATTSHLAELARQHLALTSEVIPNFISQDQLDYSAKLFRSKELTGFQRDGYTDICYMSGSPSHNRDFQVAAGALASVLESNPRVRLTVVGFLDFPAGMEERFASQVRRLPLTNYMDAQRILAAAEINIAPLQQNDFTNGKSQLKFFDAGAVGVPSIVSPTKAMVSAFNHPDEGIVVANSDWEKVLVTLLGDYDLSGKALGQAARKRTFLDFTPASQARAAEGLLLSHSKS
jgi:glycosyltransferase involved in cell wall biosynthesis